MYQIRKGSEGIFDVLFVSFDCNDGDIAQKLCRARVLSKEKLNVLSVQYSDKHRTFKIVMHPGTNSNELSTKVQNAINIGASLYGSFDGLNPNPDMHDFLNKLFGGKS